MDLLFFLSWVAISKQYYSKQQNVQIIKGFIANEKSFECPRFLISLDPFVLLYITHQFAIKTDLFDHIPFYFLINSLIIQTETVSSISPKTFPDYSFI